MNSQDQTTSSQSNTPFDRQPPSLISKILAFILGAGFLVLAFMFSLVALAVIVVVGLGVWGWLWWKTRAVRKQMREQMGEQMRNPAASATSASRDGYIIEGEVIREESSPTRPERLLR
jgi:uncharacterized protein HemX